MAGEETLAHTLLSNAVTLGFAGARLHRLDVARTDAGWRITFVVDGPDGPVRCTFADPQWVQLAGTWGSGLIVKELFHRPVPDVLREALGSITHPHLYTLTVRGGSHINVACTGLDVAPADA